MVRFTQCICLKSGILKLLFEKNFFIILKANMYDKTLCERKHTIKLCQKTGLLNRSIETDLGPPFQRKIIIQDLHHVQNLHLPQCVFHGAKNCISSRKEQLRKVEAFRIPTTENLLRYKVYGTVV